MSDKKKPEVPVSGWKCPPQFRRLFEVLRLFGGADFYGRPQFPQGLVIGEGADAVHLTPEVAREILERRKKAPAEKLVDKQDTIL